jgi:hypothetical protein
LSHVTDFLAGFALGNLCAISGRLDTVAEENFSAPKDPKQTFYEIRIPSGDVQLGKLTVD